MFRSRGWKPQVSSTSSPADQEQRQPILMPLETLTVHERMVSQLSEDKPDSTAIVINEVQLLLAEKRTSLSVMRTGIAVLVLPLSVVSFLIATSKYYEISRVMHFLIPLVLFNLTLLIFGVYLIVRSIIRMHHYDLLIQEIKTQYRMIGKFID